MKRYIKLIVIFCLPFLGACLPKDAYRMQYPKQKINYGANVPDSNKKSEKAITDRTNDLQINSGTKEPDKNKSNIQRKKISDTLVFYNKE